MSMEIKIPKEIRTYHESVFWGLSMRQLLCSAIAVGAAVGSYFGLRPVLDQETLSWVCILCAAPFGVAGFFTYHGMTLEKFIRAWFRSEFLCAGPRRFIAENYYQALMEDLDKPPLPDVRKWMDKRKEARSVQESRPVYKKGGHT
ncbi:PrgI family protein [Ruminococcaceae bacterium OttesenSCG-928-A16]|nr:PrgI family protein [Ruminococcaceae bacterium OttesenSCG-928-A16]